MTDAERLLRRHGAVHLGTNRHIVYLLAGHRFALHKGSRACARELLAVRSKLRQLGCRV